MSRSRHPKGHSLACVVTEDVERSRLCRYTELQINAVTAHPPDTLQLWLRTPGYIIDRVCPLRGRDSTPRIIT